MRLTQTATRSSAFQGRKSSFLNSAARERKMFDMFAMVWSEIEAWALGFWARAGR